MRYSLGDLVACLFLLQPVQADAKGGKGKGSGRRLSCAGAKHTGGDGGHYRGGKGPSHKEGDSKNSKTGNRCGRGK